MNSLVMNSILNSIAIIILNIVMILHGYEIAKVGATNVDQWEAIKCLEHGKVAIGKGICISK